MHKPSLSLTWVKKKFGKGCPQKKIAKKVTLEHIQGEKSPLFCFIKKGTYLYGGRGQNLFVTCPMFTCVFLFPHNLEYFLRPYSSASDRLLK